VALFRRNRATVLLFVCLVMLAVALGVAVSAQERALRQGSARAADRFDLIVGAPGSQTELLMNIVYLQPSAVELLKPDVLARLLAEPKAELVARSPSATRSKGSRSSARPPRSLITCPGNCLRGACSKPMRRRSWALRRPFV
jgi:hypothetical protein